jgi:hypothetical protein
MGTRGRCVPGLPVHHPIICVYGGNGFTQFIVRVGVLGFQQMPQPAARELECIDALSKFQVSPFGLMGDRKR